jgi:hypothetical protein
MTQRGKLSRAAVAVYETATAMSPDRVPVGVGHAEPAREQRHGQDRRHPLYRAHPNQGFHVKLTINAEGSQGADVKHKVFWVTACIPGPTTTTGSTTTTSKATTTSGRPARPARPPPPANLRIDKIDNTGRNTPNQQAPRKLCT